MQDHRFLNFTQLLSLLQLASPALPIGAFSYSEGLEMLVQTGKITTVEALATWLTTELNHGGIRLDGAVMVRAYRAIGQDDLSTVRSWNQWLSALRETNELRQQNWQMGRALMRLLQDVTPPVNTENPRTTIHQLIEQCGAECNLAVAFAIAAYAWQIDLEVALLGYFHSWAANLVSAGVRLIPLGQTAGQQLLLQLQPTLIETCAAVLSLADDDLYACSWGLSLASMNHEVQYSRLFRS